MFDRILNTPLLNVFIEYSTIMIPFIETSEFYTFFHDKNKNRSPEKINFERKLCLELLN